MKMLCILPLPKNMLVVNYFFIVKFFLNIQIFFYNNESIIARIR